MDEQLSGPGTESQVKEVRVYYDPKSGDIVHVHQLLVPKGESIDAERIEEEMGIFEASLRQRHSRQLAHIVVDQEAFERSVSPEVTLSVDVASHALVSQDMGSQRKS